MAQWSGIIHQKHRHFNLSGICLGIGAGGGGGFIALQLAKSWQLIGDHEEEVVPITLPSDTTAANCYIFRGKDYQPSGTYGGFGCGHHVD